MSDINFHQITMMDQTQVSNAKRGYNNIMGNTGYNPVYGGSYWSPTLEIYMGLPPNWYPMENKDF